MLCFPTSQPPYLLQVLLALQNGIEKIDYYEKQMYTLSLLINHVLLYEQNWATGKIKNKKRAFVNTYDTQ